jgi:hypothetical protein
VNDFLRGALSMASLTVGLFFLRYWRTTKDRLFLLFCVAFWLLALNWALASSSGLLARHVYAFRLSAFVIIAFAVLDKNRRQSRPR